MYELMWNYTVTRKCETKMFLDFTSFALMTALQTFGNL